MEMIFSRLAATPSLKQVFAVIKVVNNTLFLYSRLPVTIATKINAAFKSAVELVLLRSDVAEIAPPLLVTVLLEKMQLVSVGAESQQRIAPPLRDA